MSAQPSQTSAAPESLFVQLRDGRSFHYVDTRSDGPVLVFLHGFTDSWRSFEPLFAELGTAFRLLALDQRGHGRSEGAEAYAIASFTHDVISFLETVVKRPVHLVGHSLGSIVAQRVASFRPDLLESLVLIGAARAASGHPDLLALRGELTGFGSGVPRDFIEAFQQGTTHVPVAPAQLAIFVEESARLHPSTWIKALDGLVDEPSERPALPDGLAILSLWGESDVIFDRAAQETLAREAPELTAVHYPDVGHAPHWEVPNRAAADIAAFVRAREKATDDAGKETIDHA